MLRGLLLAFLGLSLSGFVGPPAARATTYRFSGLCADCAGTATATLVVINDTPGTQLGISNFVSFAYDGTNLVPPFTLTNADYFSATFPVADPAYALVQLVTSTYYFNSDLAGNWSLGLAAPPPPGVDPPPPPGPDPPPPPGAGPSPAPPPSPTPSDFGTAGTYTVADVTDVVEPSSIALLSFGLAGLALIRRRRG